MPHGAYIVSAVRTAGAKKNGRLREWHPITLGAAALDGLIERTGIDASVVDDVVFGCVSQSGAQSAKCVAQLAPLFGQTCALMAGLQSS